jgi:hypothetical protein
MKSHHKLKLNKIELLALSTTHKLVPSGVLIWGSDNDSNWNLLKTHIPSGTGGAVTYSSRLGVITVNSTVAYKYHAMVMTHMNNSDSDYTLMSISQMKFYGTEEDISIPLQIGGGNIDKVANFRVYDKFVGEDQALEIWDAQKDEFGRAKSSMTLHKGRLGIGTTEPEGRLAVVDEPHNLEEFPPRAMTADKTYIEGHGEFCATVTEIYPNAYAYKAFNKIQSGFGLDFHWSTNTADYDNVTGVYTGSSDYFTNVEGQIALGHWIQIDFPYKINYRYSEIQGPDHAAGRQPHTGYIVGSNDLSGVWTSLHKYSGMTRTGVRDFVTYTPPTISTQSFKYFRLVIEKLGGGNGNAGVSQWHIFGTREQGQSVLHDGQLTLTKSLNVPRIGPALDADDTPRRDRLVVEYNTSTNQPTGTDPTFGGVVRDTSGRGNDGVYYRRAAAGDTTGGYNATEKAFEFASFMTPEQHIQTPKLKNPSGNWVFSVSCWFKTNSLHTGGVWQTNPGGTDSAAGVQVRPDGTVRIFVWGTTIGDFAGGYTPGEWVHVVALFKGVDQKGELFINGSSKVLTNNNSPLNLSGDNRIYIGSQANTDASVSSPFDGFISQFKLYDTVLTAEEAKTLYDMGRCDEGGHVVNFSKTRVGIGLGNGEAPRAVLDVRGDIRYINIAPIALPTFYDHILAGRSDRGIYPIVGTQGGTKIYNVYCEPDMYGGGWMCFAQVPQVGDIASSVTWNLYTDKLGNSNVFLSPQNSTTRRHAMFSVPMNILSNNNGQNLDVLLMVYGNGLRNNGTFGAKVGAIWRGVNLNNAFNSNFMGATGSSNQARSSNGVDFAASSLTLYKSNTGWDFSISVNGEHVDGGYGDTNDGTAGYIVHGVSNGWNLYSRAINGPGGSWQYVNSAGWEYVRFFVRPSSF